MTVEQPHFGGQVRQIRRAQGLSQSDLAGEEMSPSYISLVESGRRAPSLKLARIIAERLSTPLEALITPHQPEQSRPHRLSLVGRLVAARAHQLAGDWGVARDELLEIVALAGDPELEDVRWEARWELAATLGRLGECAAREETLRALLADPLTESSPLLYTRVAVETARQLRDGGNLTESVRCAEEAVRRARTVDPPAPSAVVEAVTLLLSVCTESGDWERAEGVAGELSDVLETVAAGQLRATALWAAAGARHVNGDTGAALSLLDRAKQDMAQPEDLPSWARLRLAAGLLHVAADRLDTADALLHEAGQVTELVGSPADRVRLEAGLAAVALRRGDGETARAHAAELDTGAARLHTLDRARCSVVSARVHRALGEQDAARERFESAAALYERVGAYRIAVGVWRELSTPEVTWPEADPHLLLMP